MSRVSVVAERNGKNVAGDKMKTYNIGDMVWWAHISTQEIWVTCPDCVGKKYLTVILGDESSVTIDCAGCSAGYDPPRGSLREYETKATPKKIRISRITLETDSVEYLGSEFDSNYCLDSEDLFDTEEEAEERSKQLMKKFLEEQDHRRIQGKDSKHRTWAWHVTYHRQEIKRAEKNLAYHIAKIEVARGLAKEESKK